MHLTFIPAVSCVQVESGSTGVLMRQLSRSCVNTGMCSANSQCGVLGMRNVIHKPRLSFDAKRFLSGRLVSLKGQLSQVKCRFCVQQQAAIAYAMEEVYGRAWERVYSTNLSLLQRETRERESDPITATSALLMRQSMLTNLKLADLPLITAQ
jgi:hypothetical protein